MASTHTTNTATGWAAYAINRVRVHRSWQGLRNGKQVWFKRRRLGMSGIIAAGNVFFRAAGASIEMITSIEQWLQRETTQWQQLHGAGCGRHDTRTLWTSPLPGVPLSQCLHNTPDAVRAFAAAGLAVAAFHRHCALDSHGDLHIDNILYDAASQRANILDFDTLSRLPDSAARKGEDLAIFLLDLHRRVPAAALRTHLTDAFLAASHAPEVRQMCRQRLEHILKSRGFLGNVMRRLRIGDADPHLLQQTLLRLARQP